MIAPSPSTPLANAVSAAFATRPDLSQAARQLLATSIAKVYPTLSADLRRTQLATPVAKGWTLKPLMPLVLDFLATGTLPDFRDRDGLACYLTDHPPTHWALPDGQAIDLSVIQTQIRSLAWTLPVALQNSLAQYWASTRWRWLSDVLMDALNISAINQPDLTPHERQMIAQLIDCPDRDTRKTRFGTEAVHAYYPHATLKTGTQTRTLLGAELLLVCSEQGQPRVLLCPPAGTCVRYTNVDNALQAWARRVTQDDVVERMTLQRYEPDGNLFDAQAAILLNQQLQQLKNLKLPAQLHLDALEAVYRHITDPASWLCATPPYTVLETLHSQTPLWLERASSSDRDRYRHYSLQLASAKKRSEGRTFLSGIADLRTFTRTALLEQLKRDQLRLEPSKELQLLPDDLQLTFSVAAGYPGGAGFVEHKHMSLTDLAINNLQGRPRGQLTVTHRTGAPLPAWLTADYILGGSGLIHQVDIGKTYPELLRAQLLADNEAARQRERDFATQTLAHLPLLALELSLQQQQGFTAQGAAYVAALMTTGQRQVDGQVVVIRHLALARRPQAPVDVVANMYIIESQGSQAGIHILYRPLYADALQQFPSRKALLEAIATPGELQASVLTWLSDAARPIYDNGGFLEPHYVRFGLGSEFNVPDIPKPAVLADDGASDELLQFLANGQLMQYLYGCNARALVDQANRESVSNAESRWKVFLEGASLLFNTLLLPLARGPFMLTGWLLSLMSAVTKDLPALNSSDPTVRELALVDLLLNVGMLIFQLIPAPAASPVPENTRRQALRSPFPRRRQEQWPPSPEPQLQQGPMLLENEGPGMADTVFDFSFSSARNQLTPSQQARLWRLQAPKPETLPEPVLNGPRRGLFNHLRNWYALIEGRWYEVRLEPEGGVVIVDPLDTHRLGPYLQSDGEGHWSLDLRLRLRGGMPPKRIAAERERKALRQKTLLDELSAFLHPRRELREGRMVDIKSQQQTLQDKADGAERLMNLAGSDAKYSDAARATTRQNFDTALWEQTRVFERLLDSRKERSELGIGLSADTAAVLLENAVNNTRKSVVIADMDRQVLYARNHDLTLPFGQALPAMLADPARYTQFVKDVVQLNERQILALELKDRYLLELFNLGPAGQEVYSRLTHNRTDEVTVLSLKYGQLQNFKYLSHKTWRAGFINEMGLALDPLRAHVRTHSELNSLNLSATDRMNVLDSLLQQYGQALDALRGLAWVHADRLEMSWFERTQALVESLYQDVVEQLAAEIKPQADTVKRPSKRPLTATGRPQKKVIKTRKHGYLIGEVKAAGTTLPIEVVEMRTEQEHELLATYSQHEDRWDEVRDERRSSLPSTPPATRALNVVKGDARKMLQELEPILKRQGGYAKVSRYPIELQESLDVEATRFRQVADELTRAIDAQPEPQQISSDRTLSTQLRSAADTLAAKGQALRLQRSLALAPTDSHLTYLLEQGQVQLASLGARLATRRDFIQEYAVNDKRGFPLWYAHFHYPNADTPKLDFTVAHLKTKEQRRESYYSLLAKAESPQSVVDVHRGEISRELAERRFLPLVP